jgi:hypothetical protein
MPIQNKAQKSHKLNNQTGGTYLPAEYHGANSGRYMAAPAGLATGAYGPQVAVSQGVIHDDVAGPNLAWSSGNMMTGGGSHKGKLTGGGSKGKQTGGTYLPAEYHGANSGRYMATPAGLATGAYGPQVAVSQGVIHDDVAGPNLAWSGGNMMTGGKKHKRSRTQRRTRSHRKSATKKNKRQQHGAGCGCGGSSRQGW